MRKNYLTSFIKSDDFRPIAKFIFSAMVKFDLYAPIVWFYGRLIRHIGGSPNRPTVLAINIERFRDDTHVLMETGELCVLGLEFEWLAILGSQFYKPGMGRSRYNPEPNSDVAIARDRYWQFLSEFLPRLFRSKNIDCVISASIDYPQDFDWGAVSHKTGTPYIVLHKENFVASPGMVERFESWSGSLGKFRGTHVVVHNEAVRQAFVRSGYVTLDQISSLGCLRMDGFINVINNRKAASKTQDRPLLTFFSFPPGIGLGKFFGRVRLWPDEADGIGYFNAFREAHITIAELAQSRPDIDVVIKPKWAENWEDAIKDTLCNVGIQVDSIPNLTIQSDIPAQKLILQSSVISSYGSTVLLEAAVAGKPVVVPHLAEMHESRYQDLIFFRENMETLFDVGHSKEEFRNLLEKRLADTTIDLDCMKKRRESFSHLVSDMSGDATARYVALFKRLITKQESSIDKAG